MCMLMRYDLQKIKQERDKKIKKDRHKRQQIIHREKKQKQIKVKMKVLKRVQTVSAVNCGRI